MQANALKSALRKGEPLAKRLSIKFDEDIRHGVIKLDDWTMPARLYDLPTIIESYKTLDRKNFYKTADISQILICKESEATVPTSGDNKEEKKKAFYDRLFQSVGGAGKREFLYPHGLTPPLKNVRKRRFRKTLRKKYVDFSEIEKEVKRLFKFDCEAIESRYEIVEESKSDKVDKLSFNAENAPSPMSVGPAGIQSTENSQNLDFRQLFGASSSDESGDDDEDDDDRDDDMEMDAENANDNDNAEENLEDDEEMDELTQQSQTQQPPEAVVPAADIAAEIAAASDLIAQNDDTEEKRQDLNRELAETRDRIRLQENEMRSIDNETLRMRLQPVLDSLHDRENEIMKQLEELS